MRAESAFLQGSQTSVIGLAFLFPALSYDFYGLIISIVGPKSIFSQLIEKFIGILLCYEGFARP